MRFVDWLRGRRLDDELDGSVSELFARASAPDRPDAGQQARVRARVGAALEDHPGLGSPSPLSRPGLALFGASGMLNSLWNATTSHRVAAAIAGGVLLLGSGMAAEASGLAPTVRDAVQHAVQGEDDEGEDDGLELESQHLNGDEDQHGNVFEVAETETDGNLIKHIGGNYNLLMRTILRDLRGEDGITVAGPDGDEDLDWATENDPKIQIPGARAGGEDPTLDDLRDALEDLLAEAETAESHVLVIVEGFCEENGDENAEENVEENGVEYTCYVERLTVLGSSSHGKPDGVGPQNEAQQQNLGGGQPEGLGDGKPENPGKPEGVGKPDSTPDDEGGED